MLYDVWAMTACTTLNNCHSERHKIYKEITALVRLTEHMSNFYRIMSNITRIGYVALVQMRTGV